MLTAVTTAVVHAYLLHGTWLVLDQSNFTICYRGITSIFVSHHAIGSWPISLYNLIPWYDSVPWCPIVSSVFFLSGRTNSSPGCDPATSTPAIPPTSAVIAVLCLGLSVPLEEVVPGVVWYVVDMSGGVTGMCSMDWGERLVVGLMVSPGWRHDRNQDSEVTNKLIQEESYPKQQPQQ